MIEVLNWSLVLMRCLRRAEEAKRIEEDIERRRREREEMELRAKEELERQKQRDLEELKRKIHEDKMRKFKERERAEKEEEEEVARKAEKRPKRPSGNPLLNRFEELSKGSQIEEELRRAEIEERRKKAKPFVLPKAAVQSSLRKSANKLARELLGGANGRKGSKSSLLKVISKECLKKLSRESVKSGRSRQDLKRSSGSRSRELAFKCGSKAGNSRSSLLQGGSREGQLNKLSRSQSAQRLNPGNSERTQRGKDMKSYLISQVLFDGQENIQASAKDAKPLLQVGSTRFSPEVEVFRMLFWRCRCLNGYFPV